jgi:hypothetical protein
MTNQSTDRITECRSGVSRNTASAYIPNDIEAFAYIYSMDLTGIATHVRLNRTQSSGDIDEATLARAELKYRRWLVLRRTFLGEPLPPTAEIDDFWHSHLLHTEQYTLDMQAVFGEYMHHFPYFGVRSDEDREDLLEAFEGTKRHYLAEFGEDIGQ